MDSHQIPNPVNHPDADGFLRAIAAGHRDQLPRLVFSDWLDEHGYGNAAAGQRYLVNTGKRPAVESDIGSPGLPTHRPPEYLLGWHDRYLANSAISDEHKLPSIMFSQTAGRGPRGANNFAWRLGNGSRDRLAHERNYLGRSHELDWHPETGEPVEPESNGR